MAEISNKELDEILSSLPKISKMQIILDDIEDWSKEIKEEYLEKVLCSSEVSIDQILKLWGNSVAELGIIIRSILKKCGETSKISKILSDSFKNNMEIVVRSVCESGRSDSAEILDNLRSDNMPFSCLDICWRFKREEFLENIFDTLIEIYPLRDLIEHVKFIGIMEDKWAAPILAETMKDNCNEDIYELLENYNRDKRQKK